MILYRRVFFQLKRNEKLKDLCGRDITLEKKRVDVPVFFLIRKGKGIVNKQTESGVIPE